MPVKMLNSFGRLAYEVDTGAARARGIEMVGDSVVDRVEHVTQIPSPKARHLRSAIWAQAAVVDPVKGVVCQFR